LPTRHGRALAACCPAASPTLNQSPPPPPRPRRGGAGAPAPLARPPFPPTPQEAFLEQWKKTVLPKLQECGKQSAAEEAGMAARKAAAARAEEERDMQEAACK
jgi:hypothetical protein